MKKRQRKKRLRWLTHLPKDWDRRYAPPLYDNYFTKDPLDLRPLMRRRLIPGRVHDASRRWSAP